ncbi:tetratricopeptide repeat protein [Roseomonas sp. 18066]|uniref:tetratricopeptide repeat protein n=1 Tax=Roseomonas sp. 18066 TaxID=2681412 RepID=UPI00135C8EFF|nr:tetratricopeptide repeat protein [Roseomonas sp. 18066]
MAVETEQPAAAAAPVPGIILYEDEHLLVVHRPAAGTPTLVTFADLTFRPRGDAVWGQEPAEKLGLNTIGLVAKRENWFPTASVEAAAPAVRAAIHGPAIAYGYSMGGYAALKHAARLGCEHSLGVCPQTSIDPADCPWDSRFHKFFDPALHAGMAVAPGEAGGFAVMLADPYMAEDNGQSSLLVRDAGVHWLRTPFMSHAAIWLLVDSRFLAQVLQLMLARDLPQLAAVMRARRHVSPHWARHVANAAFRHGHIRLANRLWKRAKRLGLSRGILSGDLQRQLGLRVGELRARKLPRRARDAVLLQTKAWPQDAGLLGRAGHLLLALSELVEAERIFRAALALRPDLGHAYIGLSLCLGGQKRLVEAVTLCQQGVQVIPADLKLRMHLATMLLNTGRADEAETQFRAVLQHETTHGKALLGLSQVLAARGDRAEAVAMARRLLEDPEVDAETCLWLGQLLLYVGEPAEAEPIFRRVLAAMPDSGTAFVGLARALERSGQLVPAQKVAMQGAALLPEDAKVQAIHKRLGLPSAELLDQEEGPPPSPLRRWLRDFFTAD